MIFTHHPQGTGQGFPNMLFNIAISSEWVGCAVMGMPPKRGYLRAQQDATTWNSETPERDADAKHRKNRAIHPAAISPSAQNDKP